MWINNIMVNDKNNESKILDWQTLCPDHPIMDLGFLICTSLTPENLNNWTKELIKSYVKTFQDTCFQLKTIIPFELEEFHNMFYNNGVFLILFCWMSVGFEMLRVTPHYKKRFMWQLKKCMKVSPKLFE